jgi:hypothetical protein
MTDTTTTNIIDNQSLLPLYSSFINSFDGTPTAFANAKQILNQIFNPSFVFLTDDGPKDLT